MHVLVFAEYLPIHVHNHPWRTEPALSARIVSKTLLYHIEAISLVANALYGCDAPAITVVH